MNGITNLGDRARGSPDLGTMDVIMGLAAAQRFGGANELLGAHILPSALESATGDPDPRGRDQRSWAMNLSEVVLTSLLGLLAGSVTAWLGARWSYRRKLQELKFQAAHEARRGTYEATLQWVRAASLASRLQAEQGRHGGAEEVDYENWPQPRPEQWELYVSDRVKDLHQRFLAAAGRVHTTAGRLRATRELLEVASGVDTPDPTPLADVVTGRDSLDAELTERLVELDDSQSALLKAMRSEVIGDN
ncbi:hypothetical protein ACIA03_09920 [Nocardioides sp. NPDC051685]|uniref:hypothetical protein n=1 Tax=Nocardioides sp. NPDC051685 TaxID=3364334 RepID=UPI00378A9DB3